MADNRFIEYTRNGVVRIKEVSTSTTCDQRSTLSLDEWNALPLRSTLQTPSNHTLETLVCSSGDNTEAVYVTQPPVNGGGDVTPGTIEAAAGTQYTYSGTLNTVGTEQDNPSALNAVVGSLANGRVPVTNSGTPNPPSGKVAKFLFRNNEPFLDSLNLSISPEGRPLIQLFYVDPNTPSWQWQATGAVANSILNFN